MSIPSLKNINAKAISANCYTREQFINYVLKPLKAFYGKTNEGKEEIIQKFKLFTPDSYEKMYFDVKMEINRIPRNKIADKKSIEKIQKILDDYKGEKSPNKLEYVQIISRALTAMQYNIENATSYINMSKKEWESTCTRDICCYIQALVDNDDIPEFKNAIVKAVTALKDKPENEIKRENGKQFIDKYAQK